MAILLVYFIRRRKESDHDKLVPDTYYFISVDIYPYYADSFMKGWVFDKDLFYFISYTLKLRAVKRGTAFKFFIVY